MPNSFYFIYVVGNFPKIMSMSYQQSEETIIRGAKQYIEANRDAAWFQVPESVYELTKLRLFDLVGITTFEPLKKFDKLTVLFIGDRKVNLLEIPTLEGLEAATSLEGLSFNSPTVINNGVESIGKLHHLKRLGLFHVQHSLPNTLLSEMKQLLSLSLSPENYQSIKILPPNLVELMLNFDRISSVPRLITAPSVERVEIGGRYCGLTSLDSLKIFPNLQYLELQNPKQLKDIQYAGAMKGLKILEINLSAIENLKTLANHPALETLKVRGTRIENISDLEHCPKLKTLVAEKSSLKHVNGIRQLPMLQKLWIGETQVQDLSPLQALSNLEELNLTELAPDSWKVLPTLTGLKTLDLSHSTFNNTSLLFRLPELRYVSLSGCPVDTTSNEYKTFEKKLRKRGGGIR